MQPSSVALSAWAPTRLEDVEGGSTNDGPCPVRFMSELRRSIEEGRAHPCAVLLAGSPGTGKSTLSRLIGEDLARGRGRARGDPATRVVTMNASCDRTAKAVADTLRAALKPCAEGEPGQWAGAGARTSTMRPQVLLRLEELDSMLPEAQFAVLAHMQRQAGRLMLVATCNVVDAVVPALRASAVVLAVGPPAPAAVERILRRAATASGHTTLPEGLALKIASTASGDVRSALRMLALTLASHALRGNGRDPPLDLVPLFRNPADTARAAALGALGFAVLRSDATRAARALTTAVRRGVAPEALLRAMLEHAAALIDAGTTSAEDGTGSHEPVLWRGLRRALVDDDPRRGVALLDDLVTISLDAARMNRVTLTALVLAAARAARVGPTPSLALK